MYRHDEHFAEHWLQRKLCHLQEEKETTTASLRPDRRIHDDVGCLSPPQIYFANKLSEPKNITVGVNRNVAGTLYLFLRL